MDWLIWTGAGVSVLGVLGLIWCVLIAMRAKKAGLSDDEMRARLKSVVILNMGALLVSALGLMMVVFGIFLI